MRVVATGGRRIRAGDGRCGGWCPVYSTGSGTRSPEPSKRRVYTDGVCRKRMIGFAVAILVLVMAGAMLYEAFDIHDAKPFFVDPEFLLMTLSSTLIFCVGIAALIRRLFSFCLSISALLPFEFAGLSHCSMFRYETFEIERLLFSPPLSATSLRI